MTFDIPLCLLTIAVALSSVLYQIALWQRKEYRWDRVKSYLLSPEGNVKAHLQLLAAVIVLGLAWAAFFMDQEVAAEILAWLSLLLFTIHHLLRIRRVGIHRPKWTIKSITATITVLILGGIYIRLIIMPDIVITTQSATFLFFLPALVTIAVMLNNIPYGLRKIYIASQARHKRLQMPKLTVIGITGSFGKTSTKYFLSQLLEGNLPSYIASPKHCNSYYCVAKHFLGIDPSTQLYIAEMAAYRTGEIKQLAAIVQPSIGIITSVSNQHLSLFGSPEKLLAAKWELSESLPADGLLIINDDDMRLKQKAAGARQKIIRYSLSHTSDVWLENMSIEDRSLTGILHIKEYAQTVTIPLISEGLAGSVLAALAGCHALGIRPDSLVSKLASLKPMPRTMAGYTSLNESFVIDDSYSGGQHAALNAIRHLRHIKASDKRVAFVPIIELGSEAGPAHEAIGKAMAQYASHIYIYGLSHQEDLRRGLGSQAHKAHWFTDPLAFTEKVTANISNQTTILLEGRVPSLLHQALRTS